MVTSATNHQGNAREFYGVWKVVTPDDTVY